MVTICIKPLDNFFTLSFKNEFQYSYGTWKSQMKEKENDYLQI